MLLVDTRSEGERVMPQIRIILLTIFFLARVFSFCANKKTLREKFLEFLFLSWKEKGEKCSS